MADGPARPEGEQAVGLTDAARLEGAAGRIRKSANAFRTISEVADELHIPQHVLRFWETKFPQVKPMKRGGGRRYYRPDDIVLLRRVADLLYTQGYTIKGVQRLLRERGDRLTGDIPPDQAVGRGAKDAADDDARAAPMPAAAPLFPDLEAQSKPAPPRLRRAPPRSAPMLRDGTPEPGQAAPPPGDIARIHGMLREILAELEALRSMLT